MGEATAGQVTVVGIGSGGWAGLTRPAQEALRAAAVIVGSSRQLALLPDLGVPTRPLPSPLLDGLDELVSGNPGLCLLASGDPTMHGIGATLARRLAPERLRIIPAVSSVSLACARLGWPQPEIAVVSLVSAPPESALAAMQTGAKVVVLCRDGRGPALVAGLLADAGWGPSQVTVLEQLGGPRERLTGPLLAADLAAREAPFDDLCLLAVAARPEPGALVTARAPGLPDLAYESDGQLTRRELRVLALAALRPGPGQLLWDVGAGSGSIGIEWMRADPLARAIAIEARPDRMARVGRNAAALGVPGLRLACGSAPEVLDDLPDPDAIFIGGGLTSGGVVETCWRRLASGGRLVAHAVTIESEAVLHGWHSEMGGQLVRAAISYSEPLGRYTTWRPALPIVQWQAGKL